MSTTKDLTRALADCMARLDSVDRTLMAELGRPREYELGEILRGRRALADAVLTEARANLSGEYERHHATLALREACASLGVLTEQKHCVTWGLVQLGFGS